MTATTCRWEEFPRGKECLCPATKTIPPNDDGKPPTMPNDVDVPNDDIVRGGIGNALECDAGTCTYEESV